MLKFLKRVLAFMAPIIQIGLGQALADEIERRRRGRRIVRANSVRFGIPPAPGSPNYFRYRQGLQPRTMEDIDELEKIRIARIREEQGKNFDQYVKDALRVVRGERD